MRVTWVLGEPFWRVAGARRLAMDLPEGATVADALASLAREHPLLGRLLRGEPVSAEDVGVLGPAWRVVGRSLPIQVFRNGRAVREGDRAVTRLQEGDRLYLFLPAVGG
ncbi:MAG: MoaD/ThiS family protein [Anaerolineae bacterium]|nr:MoaD/ThiS family protein [Anaerolineae bacterium]